MKNSIKRALCLLLTLCLVFTLLPVSASAAGASDMVRIAKGEIGTSGSPNKYTYYTGTSGGTYKYWWCAAFVSWVANQAGEASAIGKSAGVRELYNHILSHGGKVVTTPQAGDIVVYYRPSDDYYAHIGIMQNSTRSIEGNYGDSVTGNIYPYSYPGGGEKMSDAVANGTYKVIFLRPKYSNSGPIQETKIEYFDCDVQINTTKGKTVNLYKNINDSQRTDYFDQGQTAYSTKGAKVSDGSTWYQIQADRNGKIVTVWLNAGSSGVTVKNQSVPLSMSFSPSSVTMKSGESKTVSINFKGDGIYTMSYDIGNNNICSASWGNVDYSTGKTSLTLTGKTAGNTSVTVNLLDRNDKVLFQKSMSVTVSNDQVSVSANPSSLELNLASNSTGTVYVTIRGSYGGIGGSGKSDGVVQAEWGDHGSGYAVAKFTGKKVGTDNFTFYVYDDTKTNVIASTSVRITVTAPTYTVSYNANGGSGAPSSQTKQYNEVLTLSSTKPVRSGYTFKGWSATAGSSSISYQPGSSYYSDKNVTLYAVWEKNKVESSISLSTDSITLDLGSSKTISVSFSGEGIEKLHHTIQNYSICDLSWGNIDWKNGTASLTITGRKVGTTKATAYLLDEEGKFFCSKDFTVTVNSLSYTVSYNANGGSGAPSSQTKTHDKSLTLSNQKPIRSGYQFMGWATSATASSAQYQPGSSYTSNSNLMLYAVWEKNKVESSITFSPSSITLEPGASKTVSISFKGDDIKSFRYNNENMTTDYDASVCILDWSDIDWKNGIGSVTVTGGVAGTATVTVYFLDEYDNISISDSFNVTVSGSSYTVFFDAGGGKIPISDSTVVEVAGVQVFGSKVVNGGTYGSLPTPTRSGYTFEGWYTSPNDGQLITSGTTVKLSDDQTLYAHWKKNSNQSQTTVSFDDVNPDDWFAESVQWAIERGITVGTSNTKFSPHEMCSVAQILTFIWRANGSPEPTFANVFSDVPSGSYYEKPAVWAREMGMVSGNRLDPLAPCTRAMAVGYLWKAANSPYAPASNQFTDVPSSYTQAVDWAVSSGITYGTSDTTFSPDVTCTRAQIITFLYRNMA